MVKNPLKRGDYINEPIDSYIRFYNDLVQLLGEQPLSWIASYEEPKLIRNKGHSILVIDWMTPNYISLTHYPKDDEESDESYMRNPQVVFEISDNRAEPIYLFNDATGDAKQAYSDDTKLHYWPKAKRELETFCLTWFKSLREQGYFSAGQDSHE